VRATLVVLAAAVTGCGSYATYKTTRIAPPGRTQLLFGAQVAGVRAVDRGVAPMPELAIAARRGVAGRYEVQANGTLFPVARAVTGSLELAGKVRLVARGRWSLAAGAGVGYRIAESSGAIIEAAYGSVPLIGGVDLGRHQLVVGITGGYQRWYSSGAAPVSVPFLGQSIGFLWQVGERWAVLPEVGTAWTPTPNFMLTDSRLFHAGIAAVWTR
jgi:hypothetical protein